MAASNKKKSVLEEQICLSTNIGIIKDETLNTAADTIGLSITLNVSVL